jgi:hypothetical protein
MDTKNNTLLALGLALAGFSPSAVFAAENPMDHMGIEHNVYLECLSQSKNRSVSPLQRLVDECGVDPGMPTDEFVKIYQPAIESDPSLPLAIRMALYRNSYTTYEFSYFQRMDNVFNTAKDAVQADAMLAALEAEAIAKLDPKSHAGGNILGGLSIARHSLRYWTETEPRGGMQTARWPRWLRKLAIVASDIAGGLIATELGAGAFASSVGSAASDFVGDLIP